jgi:hypothetical protein
MLASAQLTLLLVHHQPFINIYNNCACNQSKQALSRPPQTGAIPSHSIDRLIPVCYWQSGTDRPLVQVRWRTQLISLPSNSNVHMYTVPFLPLAARKTQVNDAPTSQSISSIPHSFRAHLPE